MGKNNQDHLEWVARVLIRGMKFDFGQSKPPVELVVCTSPKRAYYRLASQEALKKDSSVASHALQLLKQSIPGSFPLTAKKYCHSLRSMLKAKANGEPPPAEPVVSKQ